MYSATTLKNYANGDVKKALENQLPGIKLTFLTEFELPHSLQKVNAYEEIKMASNDVILAGDYLEFPSLQGALASGRKAAEEILART